MKRRQSNNHVLASQMARAGFGWEDIQVEACVTEKAARSYVHSAEQFKLSLKRDLECQTQPQA